MDSFALVRAYYRAVNGADIDTAAQLHDPACVVENLIPGGTEEILRGREAVRARLAGLAAQYEPGFEDGTWYRVRTVGGIETGWGWVRADWIARFRERASGSGQAFRGYTYFLVEDDLIRRQRSVAQPVALDTLAVEPVRSERQYPTRPVVGVGAVVIVASGDSRWLDGQPVPDSGGVVLIRRKFEPLAGQWSLPGGTLELGETLEAGIARETLEETGLAVEVGPVVDVFDRILFDQDERVRNHFVLIDYLCRPTGGRLAPGSDVSDVAVADPADLHPFNLTGMARSVIERGWQDWVNGKW